MCVGGEGGAATFQKFLCLFCVTSKALMPFLILFFRSFYRYKPFLMSLFQSFYAFLNFIFKYHILCLFLLSLLTSLVEEQRPDRFRYLCFICVQARQNYTDPFQFSLIKVNLDLLNESGCTML